MAFDENLYLRGTDARFCRRGVQSLTSVKAQLKAAGVAEGEAETRAEQLADFAQITSELPDEDATYWKNVDPSVCSFDTCNAKYGSVITSRPALPHRKRAYDDHLEFAPAAEAEVKLAACCFAGSVRLRHPRRGPVGRPEQRRRLPAPRDRRSRDGHLPEFVRHAPLAAQRARRPHTARRPRHRR